MGTSGTLCKPQVQCCGDFEDTRDLRALCRPLAMRSRDPRNTLGTSGRALRGTSGMLQTLGRTLQRPQGHSGDPGRCVPRVGGRAEYSWSRELGLSSSAFPGRTCVDGNPPPKPCALWRARPWPQPNSPCPRTAGSPGPRWRRCSRCGRCGPPPGASSTSRGPSWWPRAPHPRPRWRLQRRSGAGLARTGRGRSLLPRDLPGAAATWPVPRAPARRELGRAPAPP